MCFVDVLSHFDLLHVLLFLIYPMFFFVCRMFRGKRTSRQQHILLWASTKSWSLPEAWRFQHQLCSPLQRYCAAKRVSPVKHQHYCGTVQRGENDRYWWHSWREGFIQEIWCGEIIFSKEIVNVCPINVVFQVVRRIQHVREINKKVTTIASEEMKSQQILWNVEVSKR